MYVCNSFFTPISHNTNTKGETEREKMKRIHASSSSSSNSNSCEYPIQDSKTITKLAWDAWKQNPLNHVFVAKEIIKYPSKRPRNNNESDNDDEDEEEEQQVMQSKKRRLKNEETELKAPVPPTKKKHKIAYTPYVIPIERFKNILCHPYSERIYHEFIFPDKPCRFYVDIERKAPVYQFTPEMGSNLLNTIIETIRLKFKEIFPDSPKLEMPMIIDASQYPDVFSVHLIYPNTWFAYPMHVMYFLSEFFNEDEIDFNCYWASSPRPFRMAYNWKINEPSRVLIPRSNEYCLVNGTDFSWDVFVKCGVSASFASPDENSIIHEMKGQMKRQFSGNSNSNSSSNANDNKGKYYANNLDTRISISSLQENELFSKLKIMIRAIYGEDITFKKISLKLPSGFEILIVPGVYCARRACKRGAGNGFHHSHYSKIFSDNWKDIYITCASTACKRTKMYLTSIPLICVNALRLNDV